MCEAKHYDLRRPIVAEYNPHYNDIRPHYVIKTPRGNLKMDYDDFKVLFKLAEAKHEQE